ncbi:MAG: hypothetical protein COT85_03460 [Chlamydiae bacterium CG10_big_fil_rev_8_21_14_0_10_42_34]|nr:MAG: hypothetical protein COT85_03460 [Chlamydiae bacterium CG10_big_fil_rev_8_21_14_0_10_42_34]
MKTKVLICLLSIFCMLGAKQPQITAVPQGPWMTGPLLTPGATVLPFPHINIETYANVVVNTGQYKDNWDVLKNTNKFFANSVQTNLQFGLTSWLDIEVSPQVYYNYSNHAASWAFGDLPVTVDVQIYNPPSSSHFPAIKLILKESFPTGKYRKLNPNKNGTEVGGSGSYTTSLGLALGKVIHFREDHYLSLRLAGSYNFPAPVRLIGFNAYGGSATTNMNFVPSQSAQFGLGIEYTLSQNWVFAIDFAGNWARRSNYSASPGTGFITEPQTFTPIPGSGGTAIGFLTETPAVLVQQQVLGPSLQYSMAPAIEYNWSEHLGIIAGSWFTFAGKNAVQFYSGVVAFNYYH